MKKIYSLLFAVAFINCMHAQELWCDFDGIKKVYFAHPSGVLDSSEANPAPDVTNSSTMCAKYIRDSTLYDNFKIVPPTKFVDITPYADNAASAPKMTMKLYTSAPIGTRIDIQLGAKNYTTYPQGVHSEYTTLTTAQHAWQALTFYYVQMPAGSQVAAYDIDKAVIFFKPNSNSRDTFYFDDVTGPPTIAVGLNELNNNGDFEFQPQPNPAGDQHNIHLKMLTAGQVSLKLFDVFGKETEVTYTNQLNPGVHDIPVNTKNLPNGVYFYVMQKGELTLTKKLVISH